MNLFKSVLRSHYKNILLFFVSINIVIFATTVVVYDNQLKYMEATVEFNINEYDEVDREHLCELLDCSKVIDVAHNKTFLMNETRTRLIKTDFEDPILLPMWRNIMFVDGTISIYNEEAESYFVLNSQALSVNIFIIFTIVIPVSLAIFIYPLFISIRNEKENAIRQNAGNEALLANKSMIMITENIHHELNTPLEIIDNKIEKIHRVIDDYLIGEFEFFQKHEGDLKNVEMSRYDWEQDEKRDINTRLIKLTPDFEFIKTASEQIYNILEKMKGFKHMRYSNGNKTVADIFEGAFKIISISNSNYTHDIDERLKSFSIESNSFRNADLLGIAINNIKNSIEATASKVLIVYAGFDNGFLKLRVIDNGAGIPKGAEKKIFDPNFSTKSNDNSIRGNGMYLNRQIIRQGGGDTKVLETSSSGTTIELIIPVKQREVEYAPII